MCPTIRIGPLEIGAYAVALGSAILLTASVSFYRLIRGGFSVAHVTNGGLLAVWGGFLGSFLFKVIVGGIESLLRTGHLALAEGSAFMGALAGGLGTAIWYIRRHRQNMGRALDLGMLPIPLGQAIGRLGCFAAGCCFGKPTDSPLGMYLPGDGIWAVRYPTQLMSAAADLFIFYALLAFEWLQTRRGRSGWPFKGFIAISYVALYSLKRFCIEFLRARTGEPLMGPLNITHLLGAAGFAVCVGLIVWNLRRKGAVALDGLNK